MGYVAGEQLSGRSVRDALAEQVSISARSFDGITLIYQDAFAAAWRKFTRVALSH